jgi:F-type H+-transporting ATPase subunit delta
MSDLTGIARPYARAIYELAKEKDSFDKWTDMMTFLSMVVQDKAMIGALDSPKMTDKQKAELLLVISEGQVDDQGKNLINVLSDNDRLSLIPEICTLYEAYRDKDKGIVEAEVFSARALSKDDEKKLAAALKKRLGCEVKIVSKVDESLLGGAIIHAGDLVIDGSIQGRLSELATALSR